MDLKEILLIVFGIFLISIIVIWGRGFVKDSLSASSEESFSKLQTLGNVKIKVTGIEILNEEGCFKIDNEGTTDISKLIVRGYTDGDLYIKTIDSSINLPIKSFFIKEFCFKNDEKWNWNLVNEIEIIPFYIINDKEVYAGGRSVKVSLD